MPVKNRETAATCSEYTSLLLLFLGISILFAWFTGFRMPNVWSTNYYNISYFDGFYRRAFIGSFLYPLGALRFNYFFIACLQFAVLVLFLSCVFRYVYADRNLAAICVAIAFFVSPAGGYLFHEVGYADQLLYLLLFASLYFRRSAASALLIAVTVLVHEMASFTVVPVWFAIQFFYYKQRKLALFGGLLCFLLFTLIYLFFQTVDDATLTAYRQIVARILHKRMASFPVFR